MTYRVETWRHVGLPSQSVDTSFVEAVTAAEALKLAAGCIAAWHIHIHNDKQATAVNLLSADTEAMAAEIV